jgi:DNA primase
MSELELFVNKCHHLLLSNEKNETATALDYLTKRGINSKTIESNKIGYCPSYCRLPSAIKYFGKDLKKVKDEKTYSVFINEKLIVPIYSEFGLLVGFSTRKPSFEPDNTWWNLAFKKGSHLFLFDKTRKDVFNKNKIYLQEGYIDGLISLQEGLTNVAVIMGTALTLRKIALIARYCNNICFCLDVDKNRSGEKATRKFIHSISEFGFCDNISVIDHLPEGVDPDEYIMKHGIKKLLDGERTLDQSDILKICQETINDKNHDREN